MPQVVTHFLIPVILLELFRDFFVKDRKAFPVHYVFFGGLAGLLPDIDIAVYYILSFFGFTIQEVHRTFSHNLFVPLGIVILSVLFYKFKNEELGEMHLKLRNIFLVIAFGVLIHLVLDVLETSLTLFYPLSNYAIGLNLIKFAPDAWKTTIIPVIDGVLLIVWIIYLQVKHRISDLF